MGSGYALPDHGEVGGMTLPNRAQILPAHGAIQQRPADQHDVEMARSLSTDPSVPLTGSLLGTADKAEASSWVRRQQGRHAEGRGFSTDALIGLTDFGLSIPQIQRIDLYIEPWNVPSLRTAGRAGYLRGQLFVEHQTIGGRLCDAIDFTSSSSEWGMRRGWK